MELRWCDHVRYIYYTRGSETLVVTGRPACCVYVHVRTYVFVIAKARNTGAWWWYMRVRAESGAIHCTS